MDLIDTMVFGALSSLVASVIYLGLIFLLRPRIQISKVLAVATAPDGQERYAFKVRNRSLFGLLDIQAKASYTPPGNPGGARVGTGRPLTLDYPTLFDLGGRELRRRGSGTSTFVFTFAGFPDDLPETDHWSIRVGVSSRHVLSQFGGVAKRTYRGPTVLISGRFAEGTSLEVVSGGPSDAPGRIG